MNKKNLSSGVSTRSSIANVPVTREMVHARTRELTLLAGRETRHVKQSDYEQAKRELTGESDLDRQDAMLAAVPETPFWNPRFGSTGHHVTVSHRKPAAVPGRKPAEKLAGKAAQSDHPEPKETINVRDLK